MAEFIGITIGPIFQTLQMAESPAALWYASSCFSELTRLLLSQICTQDPGAVIISPFYDGRVFTDGVGRYHDRVIYKTERSDLTPEIVKAAKKTLVEMVLTDIFGQVDRDQAEYLEKYFQVHYVSIPEEGSEGNALSLISPYLDAIEGMQRCNPSSLSHPMKKILSKGIEDSVTANKRIRKSAMLKGVKESQLLESPESLKSIDNICGPDKTWKKNTYFAIVSSDGDKMSDHIAALQSDQISGFSKNCFAYTEEAAQKIGEYGGMTIYAGGDDLLFMAPVQGKNGQTVFDLCNELSNLFSEKVAGGKATPSASFGIVIRPKHFPLYEALNASFDALEKAKKTRDEKNAFCIDLRKNSGQSVRLFIAKEAYQIFSDTIAPMAKGIADEAVNSLIYVLSSFASSVNTKAKDQQTKIKNLFLNNYDNASQKRYANYVETMAAQFSKLLEKPGLIIEDEKGIKEEEKQVKAFEGILRIGKFFVEKEGKRNE